MKEKCNDLCGFLGGFQNLENIINLSFIYLDLALHVQDEGNPKLTILIYMMK